MYRTIPVRHLSDGSSSCRVTHGHFDFLDAPRGVRERLADVIFFEVGIERQDVAGGLPSGDESHNRADGDANEGRGHTAYHPSPRGPA